VRSALSEYCKIAVMANLASVLKSEVARLARKELRAATEQLCKASVAQRAEIAALKRRVQELEKRPKSLTKLAPRTKNSEPTDTFEVEGDASGLRFRAAGMASNRKRLGLSAEDFGLLVGATGHSVHSWERGKSKPRAKNIAAIAALRSLGKREAMARLAALKQGS